MSLRKQRRLGLAIALALITSVAPIATAASLRLTTWNLDWFPNGTPKEAPPAEQDRRIHAAADVLRRLNPDIILLQEIRDYETAQRLADTVRQGAYQIAICSAFKDGGQTGRQQVVILAKEPAQAAWAEAWKSMEGVDPPRGFAFAWLKIKGADLGVYCVHLKSNLVMRGDKAAESAKNIRKREVATQQLLDHIKAVVVPKMPAVQSFVIGGDFNTNREEFAAETTLTSLEQDGFQNCMNGLAAPMRVTHPGSHGYPDTTFDYFLAKGATLGRPEITRSQASDHLPVTCEITLNANASSPVVQENPQLAPANAPAPTSEQFTTITHAISMKLPFGSTVLQPGTKLTVVSRDTQTVRVRYMDSVYEIPISATDLGRN